MKKNNIKFPNFSISKFLIGILIIVFVVVGIFSFNKPETAEATWWNDSWSYRKALTINSDQVAGDLTDFPVLVSLTDTNLSTHAQEDGDDFIFINSEGKKLSHEIESYASSTGVLVAWVKIPSLSSTQDTDIFMYYGNASVSSSAEPAEVWDDDYKAVLHLSEDYSTATGTFKDSTGISNDCLLIDPDTDTTKGVSKVGEGLDFNGDSDLLLCDSFTATDGATTLTLEGWIKQDTLGVDRAIIDKADWGPLRGFSLGTDDNFSDEITFGVGDYSGVYNGHDTNPANLAIDTWYHIMMVWNGGTSFDFYLNGNSLSINDWPGNGTPSEIGTSTYGFLIGYDFDGIIDEMRISDVNRSSVWAETSFNNQNNPASFFAESAEEIGPGPVGYWSFDEGYGTTAHDESASKNDGSISGATWKDESECVSGKCLYFDGTDDLVTISDSDVLDVVDNYTMCVWSKWQDISNNMSIFSKIGAFKLDVTSSGQVRYTTLGQEDYESEFYPETNKWYHICVAMDSDYDVSFYVDGKFLLNAPFGAPGYVSSNDLFIGTYIPNYFHGYIDEVKIYPYERTADQIKQDYNAGLSGMSSKSGVAVSFGGNGNSWMSDGLVGYWKMDDAIGTWDGTADEVVDVSGNGNHGVRSGNASTTGGKFGNGGTFDGDSDYVNLGQPNSLDFLNGVTISAWFNHRSGDSYECLFSQDNNSPQVNIRTDVGDGTKWKTRFFVNSTEYWVTDSLLASSYVGIWKHILFTYDNEKGTLYIDGIQVDQNASMSGPLDSMLYDNFIGYENGTAESFDGQIDELRIYNRALSKSEVRKLYEWAPGPVLHLNMNEKSGGTVYDTSGNGNDGTITSASWGRGKFGSALEFDGVDDYVSAADSPVLSPEAFTLSAWVNFSELKISDIIAGKLSEYWMVYDKSSLMGCVDDRIGFAVYTGSFTCVSSLVQPEINRWYYVTGVHDGAYISLYVDGILQGSPVAKAIISDSSSSFDVGSYSADIANYAISAAIDDVKVYNYVRTQKQILEDMNNGQANKSPVLHLSFDKGRGETVYDSSIYKNNGTANVGTAGSQTATSSMWDKDGKTKGAMEFDGVDDKLEIDDSSSLSISGNEITLSAWVYPTAVGPSSAGRIISKENGASGDDYSLRYYDTELVYFRMRVGGGNDVYVISDSTLLLNTWTHVMGVYDGAYMKLYFDSEEVGVLAETRDIDTNNEKLGIGGHPGASSRYFPGKIDEVKIWNFALNEEEIKEEYNSGGAMMMGGGDATADDNGTTVTGDSTKYCIPGDTSTCSPPVLEMNMNEKKGGTVYDTSGNGNDGTMMYMATSTNGGWIRGKKGSGLSFDGVDDALYIGTPSVLDFAGTDEFTLETWFKTSVDNFGNVVSKYGGPRQYSLYMEGDGRAVCLRETSPYNVYSTTYLDTDTWNHIACRYNGTELSIYVNGVRENGTNMGSITGSGAPVIIGNNDNNQAINGDIDEVRIFDYARTPAQIAWDYNKGAPIAHYEFDECSGGVIHDMSGNGNHGALNLGASGVTVAGTCASSSDSFWYNGRDGKRKGAGSFDGNGDSISLGNNTIGGLIDGSTAVTISSWFFADTIDGSSSASNSFVEFVMDSGGQDRNSFLVSIHPTERRIYMDGRSQDGDSSQTIVSKKQLDVGIWYHYMGVYDYGKGLMNIYIDGELDNSTSVSWGGSSYTHNNASINDNIGNTYAAERYFDGKIDDFRVYNYALTGEQVKNVYNDGAVNFR